VSPRPPIPLEDRLSIDGLVTEYAWLLDHRRFDDVLALFTEDAELRIRGQRITGADGLQEWLEERAANQHQRSSQHQMSLLRLEPVDDGRIRGTAALVLHVAKSGSSGTYVDLVGEYQDEYVRTDEGWRFRRRVLVTLADM
jgi:3-phenylpropionate/cinnamic acid dioxygenase small subunit